MAMHKKANRRDKQNKNRSKLSKQQIASTSKYSESTFLRLEVGTIARIDEPRERVRYQRGTDLLIETFTAISP
jgi:biotin synthase-related radical SAM superfamily protein